MTKMFNEYEIKGSKETLNYYLWYQSDTKIT